MTVIDEMIGNSINPINNSKILKDRQEKKDNRNLVFSLEDKNNNSLEALDVPFIIFDKEENIDILDFRLKKIIFFC